jgi:hypothetical protein
MNPCPACKRFAEAYGLQIMPDRFLGANPKAVGSMTVFVCTSVQKPYGATNTNWTGHTASGAVVLLQNTGPKPDPLPNLFNQIRRGPMRDVVREGLFLMDGEEDTNDADEDSPMHLKFKINAMKAH